MEDRRILFLDLDGVLASIDFLCDLEKRKKYPEGEGFIDPEKVALLNQLSDLGVEVVISSSWGTTADEPLIACGLKLPIVGHTSHFHSDDKYEYVCRGNEIERWLLMNLGMSTKWGPQNFDITKYAIVDDDDDMLYGQRFNFLKINRDTGITQEDIDKLKDILK